MFNRLQDKVSYYKRIFPAYLRKKGSHLGFFHEKPAINENCPYDSLGEYYMTFFDKAQYDGPFDGKGVPLLDFRGKIGRQYVPVAITQYGLGNYNIYKRTGDTNYLEKAILQADWLIENLENNSFGIPVWNFHFDWEYKEKLMAPWYSGLSQGLGISLLTRIYSEKREAIYIETAQKAYIPLELPVEEGGVIYIDEENDPWIEESIIDPPTHVLNGFLWAIWGVWDLYLLTEREQVREQFDSFAKTIEKNLYKYDTGYWSLYELAALRLKMLASPFYHSLHCVQLKIMAELTGKDVFKRYAGRWETYAEKRMNRLRALTGKILFKLIHY